MSLVINEKGERLPLSEAMKRMRRVNIFTHCAGNFRFDGVLRELKKAMSKLGYIKQEQDFILGQVCVVGYTPWAMIKDDHIKKLYIQSIEDIVSPKLAEHLYRIQREDFPRHKVEVSEFLFGNYMDTIGPVAYYGGADAGVFLAFGTGILFWKNVRNPNRQTDQ